MTANQYPFVTKRQVFERLARDNLFLIEALGLLHERHLARSGGTSTGPSGWSSSDRQKAERLYHAIAEGTVDDNDMIQAISLLKRYARQIAVVLREQQLATDPSLRPMGLLFGVVPSTPNAMVILTPTAMVTESTNVQATEASLATTSAAPESSEPMAPATPKTKRGRPLGSKNRTKTGGKETKQTRRRKR